MTITIELHDERCLMRVEGHDRYQPCAFLEGGYCARWTKWIDGHDRYTPLHKDCNAPTWERCEECLKQERKSK